LAEKVFWGLGTLKGLLGALKGLGEDGRPVRRLEYKAAGWYKEILRQVLKSFRRKLPAIEQLLSL
jgi:hypothetical protein